MDSASEEKLEQFKADQRATEAQVATAIKAAKDAAIKLGVSEGDTQHMPLVSFGLNVEGMEDAFDAQNVQTLLNDMEGVQANVIYDSESAWVTARANVSARDIVRELARQGYTASMKQSSLHRYESRLQEGPRRRRVVKKRKLTLREQLDRNAGEAVRAGDTEVLATRPELLTLMRTIITALFAIPVLAMALFTQLQFTGWQWVSLALATPVVMWGAWPFHRALLSGLSRQMPALDSASSLAVISAYLWSLGSLVLTPVGQLGYSAKPQWLVWSYSLPQDGALFLDVACGVTLLLLVGRQLSQRTQSLGNEVFAELKISPDSEVTVMRRAKGAVIGTGRKQIPVSELRVNDDIVVPQGGMIPVDGEVIGGSAEIDPGPASGKKTRTRVKVHSTVFAGAVNHGAPLKIRVVATGSRTRLAQMQHWLHDATRDEARVREIATRSASILVPWGLAAAVALFSGWWLATGSPHAGLAAALALLAGIGPVALATSAPTALRLGLLHAASNGVLIRGEDTFENLANMSVVIFNRNGALTDTNKQVLSVHAVEGENPEMVLRVAGALAMESNHAIPRALVRACRQARDSGAGGSAIPHWIDVSHVEVFGNGDITGMMEIPMPDGDGGTDNVLVPARISRPNDLMELPEDMTSAALSGGVPLTVYWKGKLRGIIQVSDELRDGVSKAVDDLDDLGIESVMLSRDDYLIARRSADRVGMSAVLAGVAPDRKDIAVRSMRLSGDTVGMVGKSDSTDALKVADVGILLLRDADDPEWKDAHAHLDLEYSEADVALLQDKVTLIPEIVQLARRVHRILRNNLFGAWTYNICIIILAATGLLHPMMATLLMILSSVAIEFRSRRLLRHFRMSN